MTHRLYDIAIIGGGMVGMTLACALAKNPSLSILILESAPESIQFDSENYHHRVSAVALSSVRLYKSLHVWEAMRSMRVSPFQSIQVWDAKSEAQLKFECNEISEPVLGYIIENNVMQKVLREKLATLSQINFVSAVKLTELRRQEEDVLLRAENAEYCARLVVAADGANSWLRKQAGIAVRTDEYDQEAIVATVQTELPHDKNARQVFLATGPLAFLPLKEARTSSIVWSLPKEEARRLVNINEELFKHELQQAFAGRLGSVQTVGPRFTFPLKKQQAEHYVLERVALVGDAAHVMHPLAGQGVNLGLLDAASLAEVMNEAFKSGHDLGSLAVLRRYERWRRTDNLALLTGVDIIKHLFASDKISIQTARSLGMAAAGRFAMLKNIFTRYAVGSRDGLPELARVFHDG